MRIHRICLLAGVMSLVVFGGCASTHENVAEHHHHEDRVEFEGKCAYSVEIGKYDVDGNPEFKLSHLGVTYYFSSADARTKFSDHIQDHINRANKSWNRRERN